MDITLDNTATTEAEAEADTLQLSHALASLTHITKLTLRKHNVYLSQPKPRHIIAGLAHAIDHWKHLVRRFIVLSNTSHLLLFPSIAHIAFRLADDATGTGALLADSLSRAPALHALLTQLPAVWNPALLCISSNPRLERIILNPNADHHHYHYHNHAGNPVVGTNLFLMEASKWPRLGELIRAGTNILHTREHVMDTVCVSATVGNSSSTTTTPRSGSPCCDAIDGEEL